MHVTHDPTRSNIAAPAGRSRPWGLSQLAPFPKQGGDSGHLPYRVHLDPVKQTGVYTDPITHQPIEAGKHGTSKQKASPTAPPEVTEQRRRAHRPAGQHPGLGTGLIPMTAPVLAVACLDDPTTDLVLDELHDRDIPVVRFDPGADFPDEIALSAHFDGRA